MAQGAGSCITAGEPGGQQDDCSASVRISSTCACKRSMSEELKAQLQAEQAMRQQALAPLQQIHQLSAATSNAAVGATYALPPVPSLVLVKPEASWQAQGR